MKCLRCKGWLVRERVFTREGGMSMARCVYCGDLIDPIVIQNRHRPAPRARGERHYRMAGVH
ncbi:MAG: hypothetical protein WAO55_08795 [Candidatus Manganitrophaceae bacterium]